MCADGNPYGFTWDGDPFPQDGVDETSFDLWVQASGVPAPIPMGWQAQAIESAEDSVSFSLAYQPTSPYLALSAIHNQESLVPGGTVDLTMTVVNYGSTTDGGTVTVFPESFLPSFQLQVPVGVQPLDTVELEPLGNVQISDDFAMVGARVPIGIAFEANVWQDTLSVYLPEASGAALPLCTGPVVGNAAGDLRALATAPSVVTGLRHRQVIWNRTVQGSIVGIAFDPTVQYVGVATDLDGTGHVYLLNAGNGTVRQHWSFPGQQLAQPGVAFAYGYITFVVADRLYRFTSDGIPFDDVQRETLGLPMVPTGFACGFDSTYCIVGGDTAGYSGFTIVLNFWGERVFPLPGDLIPVDGYAYLPPLGGDLNGDGIRTEYVVPYSGASNGGYKIIAYSLYWDSLGVGDYQFTNWGSNRNRQPVEGAFGWSRNLLDDESIGSRLLIGSSGTAPQYSSQMILDGSTAATITVAGEASWYAVSLDLAGLGSNVVTLATPNHGDLRMYNSNGTTLVPGGLAATIPGGELFNGPPLVVRGEDWTSEVWVPGQDVGGWRYKTYRTQGFDSDWFGKNGGGQNTRCHGFRGELGVPGSPDSAIALTVTYSPSQGELLLAWAAGFQGVQGYHLYDAPSPDTPDEAWTIIRTVATTQSYAWATIPVTSQKRFYRVTAIFPNGPNPNAPDGSTFWGEHEQ